MDKDYERNQLEASKEAQALQEIAKAIRGLTRAIMAIGYKKGTKDSGQESLPDIE